jgi:hypothetical protein
LVQEMLSNNTATIAPGASLDKAPVIYPREVRLISESDDVTLRRYLAFLVRGRSLSNAC